MAQVLRHLPPSTDPNVLVGFAGGDDAGVYRLNDELALVQTVDFFAPIVDDPYDFGRIAATNSLSDIYAMGGKPITALNIVAYPMKSLGPQALTRILAGGADVAREAGVAIIGGHTVEDDEPKYGLAVTGTIDPRKIVTNAGAQAGDVLFLTKPLGTGILAQGLKKGALDERDLTAAVSVMTQSNAAASAAMLAAGAHAATDITGFGLLGHAGQLARASGVRLRLHASHVPVLGRVLDLIAVGIAPGGTLTNAQEHAAFTDFTASVSPEMRLLLSDAQTSGGLLIAVAAAHADALHAALAVAGVMAAQIGTVEPGGGIAVED